MKESRFSEDMIDQSILRCPQAPAMIATPRTGRTRSGPQLELAAPPCGAPAGLRLPAVSDTR